jgi:nitrite reductase/ring-hydroxylating ferredoxin subunit
MAIMSTAVVPGVDGFYQTQIQADTIQQNQLQPVTINGSKLIVVRWEGQLYAFSSVCPHGGADLTEGEMSRWKLFCPDHNYCFDVRNGRVAWPEDEPYRLKKYELRVTNGIVDIKL